MKITNAIMSTVNDSFAPNWPFASEVWNSLGVTPILLYMTSYDGELLKHPSKFGRVVTVPLIPNLDIPYQLLVARNLLAAIIPGNNMIYDIDMFPCNNKMLQNLEPIPDNFLISRTHIDTIARNKRFAGGSLAASNKTFNQIFTENKIYVTETEFWSNKILSQIDSIATNIHPQAITHAYGSDEYFMFQCVANMKNPPPIVSLPNPIGTTISNPHINPRDPRLKIPTSWDTGPVQSTNVHWTFEFLREGKYWEAHIRLDTDKKLTRKVCDIIMGREYE